MFGTKKYKVSATKTDPKGKKTTITISTDDENVVRKLLDQPKDFMDAEVKDSKQTSKSKKKSTSKATKKETKKKVVALPIPKKKADIKPKESNKKKEKKPTSKPPTKKPGSCIFSDSTGRFSIYKKSIGFDLYDKEDCVSQLLFVYDDVVAMKTFREKIKEILADEKKK